MAVMPYERLPNAYSTRLFSLRPGKAHDGIEGCLMTVSLQDCPPYEALSYVVGDTSVRIPIGCDGDICPVTENLRAALLHLRQVTGERLLWIDQICINQTDPQERNQQVSMMGQIFHKPQRVLVWLGPADEDTPAIWHFLSDLAATQDIPDLQMYHMDLMVKPAGLSEGGDDHPWSGAALPPRLSNLPPRSSPKWNALRRFLIRPWFSRVWTFQEGVVCTSSTVYCGSHTVPWLVLSDACKALRVLGLSNWIGEAQRDVAWISIQSIRWHSGIRSTFHFLLGQIRSRNATDPKDRIYALRALVRKPAMIQVDYGKALQDIYSDAVKTCIVMDDCLSILSDVEVRRTDESARLMPSWVPDWRFATSVCTELALRTVRGSKYFDAAGKTLPCVLPSPDSRTLTLRGYKIASVFSIFDLETRLRLNEPCLKERDNTCGCGRWDPDSWRKMYRAAAASIQFPSQSIRHPEKLDRTIASVGNDGPHEGSRETVAVEMAFRRAVTADLLPRVSGRLSDAEARELYPVCASVTGERFSRGDAAAAAQLMLEYDTCVAETMFNRRLFVAGAEGLDMYMGVALGTVRRGDCVCVLFGGDTPFLLRPASGGGGGWRFVAEAYVYGIMDGEAVRGSREDGVEYQDFSLV